MYTYIDSRIYMTCTLKKNSKKGKTQRLLSILLSFTKKKIQKSSSKVKEPLDLLILQSKIRPKFHLLKMQVVP